MGSAGSTSGKDKAARKYDPEPSSPAGRKLNERHRQRPATAERENASPKGRQSSPLESNAGADRVRADRLSTPTPATACLDPCKDNQPDPQQNPEDPMQRRQDASPTPCNHDTAQTPSVAGLSGATDAEKPPPPPDLLTQRENPVFSPGEPSNPPSPRVGSPPLENNPEESNTCPGSPGGSSEKAEPRLERVRSSPAGPGSEPAANPSGPAEETSPGTPDDGGRRTIRTAPTAGRPWRLEDAKRTQTASSVGVSLPKGERAGPAKLQAPSVPHFGRKAQGRGVLPNGPPVKMRGAASQSKRPAALSPERTPRTISSSFQGLLPLDAIGEGSIDAPAFDSENASVVDGRSAWHGLRSVTSPQQRFKGTTPGSHASSPGPLSPFHDPPAKRLHKPPRQKTPDSAEDPLTPPRQILPAPSQKKPNAAKAAPPEFPAEWLAAFSPKPARDKSPEPAAKTRSRLLPQEYTEDDYKYAEWIGIDLEEHPHLMYIAREGLRAAVPEPWVASKNREGVVYFNKVTMETSRDHPLDKYYKAVYKAAVEGTVPVSLEAFVAEEVLPKTDGEKDVMMVSTGVVRFSDVSTGSVVVLRASSNGLVYSVNGDARPLVKKVTFDPSNGVLRFVDINKGVTISRDSLNDLIPPIRQLCQLSSVAHNIPYVQASSNKELSSSVIAISPPTRPYPHSRQTNRTTSGLSSSSNQPANQHPPLSTPSSDTLASSSSFAKNTSPALTSLPSATPASSTSPATPATPDLDDLLLADCFAKMEQAGVSRDTVLSISHFSDTDIDELLRELAFNIIQRHKLKIRLEAMRMDRVAEVKNREIELQMQPPEPGPASSHPLDCRGDGSDAMEREAEENARIVEWLGTENVPEEYLCTITGDLILEPVCTVDGHVYEKSGITAWLMSHDTSPNTNKPLESKNLIPNIALRKAIDSWRQDTSSTADLVSNPFDHGLPVWRGRSQKGEQGRGESGQTMSPVTAVLMAMTLSTVIRPPTLPPGGLPVRKLSIRGSPPHAPGEKVALCPDGHIVRKVDQISIGMNATSLQVRMAFKDMTTALHAPFVYAIASLKSEVIENERSVALAFMLGGMKVVLRKPPRQGIGIAPCQGSKLTMEKIEGKIAVKVRRDLQWALALWHNASFPALYICRDPSCRPLGANEFLPERRIFSDNNIYTRRQFIESFPGAEDTDWKKGTVVPHNVTEEITKSQLAPNKAERASQHSALGSLVAKEVLVDFDPRYTTLEEIGALAFPGSIVSAAEDASPGGEVNCAETGCLWQFPKGPNVRLSPREFPENSVRMAQLRAMVWTTPYLERVEQEQHHRRYTDFYRTQTNRCIKLTLQKYGIPPGHTGMWFCPHKGKKSIKQTPEPAAAGDPDLPAILKNLDV
eukprot:gene18013-27738_t